MENKTSQETEVPVDQAKVINYVAGYDVIPCKDMSIAGRLKAIHALAVTRSFGQPVFDNLSAYPREAYMYLIAWGAYNPALNLKVFEGRAFVVCRPTYADILRNRGLFARFSTEGLKAIIDDAERLKRDPIELMEAEQRQTASPPSVFKRRQKSTKRRR